MSTENQTTGPGSDTSPYGKVMGIVENREQLQAISSALSKIADVEFKVLGGNNGVNVLDQEKDAVADFFLGDMESKMVQGYLDAVKKGWIVFAANTPSDSAPQVADIAKAHGATMVVHFGEWVITNY